MQWPRVRISSGPLSSSKTEHKNITRKKRALGGERMVAKKRKRAAILKREDRTWSVEDHILVPKHSKLSEKDKKELLAHYHIEPMDLPRIFINDPAIQHLDVKQGDVIKIERNSPTAGTSVYYRAVIEGI